MTVERNFNTAVTEFQRRFHISADEENRHRSSINQVISCMNNTFNTFKEGEIK